MIKEHNFYSKEFLCYPMSTYAKHAKHAKYAKKDRDIKRINASDKIILPPSSLEHLTKYLEGDKQMMFKLSTNNSESRELFCGVLEFDSPEHTVYVPDWLLNDKNIKEGQRITLTSVELPKGTFVRIKPDEDFLKLTNPKVVLEYNLRNFTTLYEGERIKLSYLNRDYHLEIVKTEPDRGISINNTNLEIDIIQKSERKQDESSLEREFVNDHSSSSSDSYEDGDGNDYWSNLGSGCKLK